MKIFRNLMIATLGVFAVQYCSAQSAMKEPVEFKLSNGLTVVVAENPGCAKVYTSFTIDAEPVVESNKPGANYLLNALLNETAVQTEAGVTFDEKGGNLAAFVADFDKSLAVLSASVQKPVMDQVAFDKVKAKLIAGLKAKDSVHPEAVTEAALQALTLKDMETLYSKNIKPSRAYLTIAGNITVAAAKTLAKKSFSNWGETTL